MSHNLKLVPSFVDVVEVAEVEAANFTEFVVNECAVFIDCVLDKKNFTAMIIYGRITYAFDQAVKNGYEFDRVAVLSKVDAENIGELARVAIMPRMSVREFRQRCINGFIQNERMG